jgi:hypothetical protein
MAAMTSDQSAAVVLCAYCERQLDWHADDCPVRTIRAQRAEIEALTKSANLYMGMNMRSTARAEAAEAQAAALREILAEWLPIAERQLNGMVATMPANQMDTFLNGNAYKTALARIERMRAALAGEATP